MKFLNPLCRACSRGRDHGRGQKNAGETISFTLLTLTSFSCTALLFFQLAPTTALQWKMMNRVTIMPRGARLINIRHH